ncbi:PREDICTED: UPF0540 protein At1g62060-like [Camelina sativa]|uniref:UPF0540 protein At1g62060-like n=1 Tax=Camelina sativa TaxID=90675 RepID=A0ABM0TRQ7_CAMSA|nr:PREDICTED: UPF0540 protein At1g62060-like [Camelina sativa]
MKATKLSVLLVIGILFAIVTARQVEEVSKENKLGTSAPKTATKGIGAELAVDAQTDSTTSGSSFSSATQSPKGPIASSGGFGFTSTRGNVSARGRNADASSTSGSSAQGNSAAAADRKGAAARGDGSSGSASTATGRTTDKKKKKKKKKCGKDKKRCD